MYASVRRYRAMDAEALIEKMQEEFVERVKMVEGFVAFYVIDGGAGTVTSITVAETEEAAEASTVRSRVDESSRESTRVRWPAEPSPMPVIGTGATP